MYKWKAVYIEKCTYGLEASIWKPTMGTWQGAEYLAYVDMTMSCHLFGTPENTAKEIKNRIRDELGFTVNVGVSDNKMLAKTASDFRKPDLVHTLYQGEIQQKMCPSLYRTCSSWAVPQQRNSSPWELRLSVNLPHQTLCG